MVGVVKSEGKCDVCKGNLTLKEVKELAGSKYRMLECEKCHKTIARREDYGK